MDSGLNKIEKSEKNKLKKDKITGYQKDFDSLKANDKRNFDHSRVCDITIEEVRQFDKFKALSDDQAIKIIETVKSYVAIIYNLYSNPKQRDQTV